MFQNEEEDNLNPNDSLEFSILDKANIEDLEPGQTYKSETGEFEVNYLLPNSLKSSTPYKIESKTRIHFCKNLDEVFEYLESSSQEDYE